MNANEVVEKVLPKIDRPVTNPKDMNYTDGLMHGWNDARYTLKSAILSGVLVPRDEQSTKTPNPS